MDFRGEVAASRRQVLPAADSSYPPRSTQLGHGGNDAQKTMGIIAGVLVAADISNANAAKDIPLWVVLICHAAIGFGTLSGGWRIVHTMG